MAFVVYKEKPAGGYYPTNSNLYFGVGENGSIDSAHFPYAVPVARFEFYNNRGEPLTDAPIIYVRFTTGFDTNLSNGWQQTQAFGGAYAGLLGGNNPAEEFLGQFGLGMNLLESVGKTAMEALTRQFINASVNVAGFASSMGAGGKTQFEFLMRRMVNNFQQLAYAGPVFRRFQPSFTLRPTSKPEAEAMNQIIASFRVASSPKTDTATDNLKDLGAVETDDVKENIAAAAEAEVNKDQQSEQAQQLAQAEAIDQANKELTSLFNQEKDYGNPLTFIYPDMVKYSIYLVVGGQTNLMFDSELCVIENVSVQYGAQSKLTFFDSDDGKYYPTEATLTLSLQETVQVTAERAAEDYAQNLTMY